MRKRPRCYFAQLNELCNTPYESRSKPLEHRDTDYETSSPLELRIRVYEAYFEEEREIQVPAALSGTAPWHNQQPPITRVSRHIRAESLPSFYGYCKFLVSDICGLCRPTPEKMLVRQTQPGPSNTCQCIAHRCYKSPECRWDYWINNSCDWIHAIGDHNLASIRHLILRQPGNSLFGHVGYTTVIRQDTSTKKVTISEQSFWH